MRRAALAAVLAGIALAGCKVDVKDGGELPQVDVKEKGEGATIDPQPGTMPDVEVSTDSLRMPNVEMPDVKAPDIDVPDVKLPEVKAPDIKAPDLTPGRERAR